VTAPVASVIVNVPPGAIGNSQHPMRAFGNEADDGEPFPEPIVLDFVQPRLARRWVRGGCGKARRDESRRQGTRQLAVLAAHHAVPAIYPFREHVSAGDPIS
jgi:hypothetical protein